MIPLLLTVALAFLSFLSSAFVILRIIVPILPPTPLSRRVHPPKFGLPNYRSLTPADKSHVWLACLDLLALALFVWQVLVESPALPSNITHDPLSTARLWLALTTRQTCLLFITALTLLYVRLGRPVSFGPKHSLLWAPTLILVATGTGVGAVLSQVGMNTIWGGIIVYSTSIALLTSGCVIGTLLLIRPNIKIAAQAEADDKECPPIKELRARRSVTSDDIEALKEGSSWITSHRSSTRSRRNFISAFSFSTAHNSTQDTSAPATGSVPSVLPKSSYWFGTTTPNSTALISEDSIPPVPRVPSPHRDPSSTPPPGPGRPLTDLSKSSATSWLTEPSASQATLAEFSFPTTRPGSPDEHAQSTDTPVTPTMVYEPRVSHSHSRGTTVVQPLAESKVLGGYGGQGNVAGLSPKGCKDVDITVFRCVTWTVSIWLPIGLSLPYLCMASPNHDFSASFAPILFVLSVTISSPLLALNLLLRAPLPIHAVLFSRLCSQTPTSEASNSVTEIRIHPEMRARGTSLTVVEGRRGGDVWIAAVDGRGEAARVLGLLTPSPRLAVLPFPKEGEHVDELTPPLPIQDKSAVSMVLSLPSTYSTEMAVARTRKGSKASSYYSGDESLAYKSQIMVAQRHDFARATIVYLPPSPTVASGFGAPRTSFGNALDTTGVISTGVERGITKRHVRSQSAPSSLQTPRSSMKNCFLLTPPPASPLPPIPPNVRAFRHSRSQSKGSGFSFGPIGQAKQIDSLSVGVSPLLVPGLEIGQDMVISTSSSPPRARRGDEVKSRTPFRDDELGFTTSISFNSPEMHSTPARRGKRSGAADEWRHLSLPYLGLGEDGVHSLSRWKDELVRVLDVFETKTPSTNRHRRAIHGTGVPAVTVQKSSSGTLNPMDEDGQVEFGYAVTSNDERYPSVPTFEPTPPTSASVYSEGFNTVRSSMATMVDQIPILVTALLSTFHDQQNLHPTSQAEPTNKSDDSAATVAPTVQNDSRAPEQWHASAKRHIPKKKSPDGSSRKLTLLGNRDLNRNGTEGTTLPLAISKKTKKAADKETSNALRPLELARSAAAKERGLLRQGEVLPAVIVRQSSSSDHTGFGYTFH